AGVLTCLFAPRSKAWIRRRGIVGSGCFTLQQAARPKLGKERWVLRIIHIFRFLFGIQMIEIAEELIEPVHRGQELVAIAKMVLAILKSHVAERLEQLGDRRILFLQADR